MSDKAVITVKDGVIGIDKDKLHPKKSKATLSWHLKDSPGWSFTETGIVIDQDPNQQFSDPYCSEDGQTFTWKDANTDGRLYKYTVWVRQGSAAPICLDPTIQNKGLNDF
jgi:hypothetical protein